MIGKIMRVPLREVWRHEARDFTTWLQVNIDILGDAIDMELTNVEREQSTGNFNVDLVAEDAPGNTIIHDATLIDLTSVSSPRTSTASGYLLT